MVPGEGPQPSLGMIVGEAPGKFEVEQGRPFVGKSGKLLDAALRAVGVSRADVYVTNVVKDVPLDSADKIRRPYAEEIEAWRPILEGEIEHTAPAVILALGRTASNVLTGLDGDIPFGSVVGNVYTAWHPAYLLRRGSYGEQLPGEEVFTVQEDWIEQLRAWAEALRAA